MRRITLLLTIATCTFAAAQQAMSPDSSWRAPKDAAARQNPLGRRSELAAGGARLFRRHCAECHGDNGQGGERKNAPDLRGDDVQLQSDGELFWKISNGNGDMPGWSRLPEAQRWQLILFLRTLRRASTFDQ